MDIEKLKKTMAASGITVLDLHQRARVNRRTLYMWLYHGRQPTQELYARVVNAVFELASERAKNYATGYRLAIELKQEQENG